MAAPVGADGPVIARSELSELIRVIDAAVWHRFDQFYGPIIGGLVILGTLVAAALAAYYGG